MLFESMTQAFLDVKEKESDENRWKFALWHIPTHTHAGARRLADAHTVWKESKLANRKIHTQKQTKGRRQTKHQISRQEGAEATGRQNDIQADGQTIIPQTSIFMAIITTSGSPCSTVAPSLINTRSTTPGMGATGSSNEPMPVVDCRYSGTGSFSVPLPSWGNQHTQSQALHGLQLLWCQKHA